MSDQETLPEDTSNSEDVVQSVSDLLNDVAETGAGLAIPKPVKRSLFKAFGRLCSAAVEVPASYLEDKANENRALSSARIRLIETNAEKMAAEIEVDPEYSRIAVRKFGQKILREQVNLDLISAHAADELRKEEYQTESKPSESETENNDNEKIIEDDWLNAFEKEAAQKSSEDMQRVFGRILAGEIHKPSTFSIRTLKTLGELDARIANKFRNFCALVIWLQIPVAEHSVIDARVPSLGGNPGQNSLQKFGFGFDQLNELHEYGLIISDYNSYYDYRMCVVQKPQTLPMAFNYAGKPYGLISATERTMENQLRVSGVALSKVGKELLPIIDVEENITFTEALSSFFTNQKLKMVAVSN
jgi:hypothetical protein